jgi:uncharacterized protein (DUF2336 family)
MSTAPSDLLNDLEQAFAQGTPETRVAALWHATDILLVGQYSEDDIWLFGEIIDRLAAELELQARAKLATLLSHSNNAPTQTIKKLAYDDSILVAGPVLRNSARLKEADLIGAARSKSQQHLFAIAQRKSLTENVTDVLVTRGDKRVAHAVAKNEGARFSEKGFWNLVKRSENDSILAECVGVRQDIPRHLFLQLIAKASDLVKQRLAQVAPAAHDQVEHAVADAAGAIHARFGPASKQYFAAKRLVTALHQSGDLDENELCTFAKQRKFEEATVAFSLLCGVTSDVAERALIEGTPSMLLILGRSAAFSWKTVESLIVMRAGDKGVGKHDLEAAFAQFHRLQPTAAKKVLSFYEARRQSRSKSLNT